MSDIRTLLLEMRSLSSARSRAAVAGIFAVCWMSMAVAGHGGSPLTVVLPLLLISVATDTTWKFIPNWLTGISAILAVTLAFAEGGTVGAMESFKGFSMVFAASIVLYAKFGLGAGDVKLCACLGACLGPEESLSMLLSSYSLSGVVPLFRIALDRLQPFFLYGCSFVGLETLGTRMLRSDLQSYLRYQQPMAGWFAAGTVLTLCGASLI